MSCNSSKKAPNSADGGDNGLAPTSKCKIPGVVRDMTGLDGCQFLIELENGEKWLPAEINDANFKMSDGQNILFGYEEITDGISICMAESKMVKITCIKETSASSNKPVVKKCWDLTNPMEATWMAQIMEDEKPFRILKYNFRDGWAYMIFTKEKRLFYTCQGNNLCPSDKDGMEECREKYLKLFSNPQVIYEDQ